MTLGHGKLNATSTGFDTLQRPEALIGFGAFFFVLVIMQKTNSSNQAGEGDAIDDCLANEPASQPI